jgi:hypothetical protein
MCVPLYVNISEDMSLTEHAGRLLEISNLLLERKPYIMSIKPQLQLQFIYSS